LTGGPGLERDLPPRGNRPPHPDRDDHPGLRHAATTVEFSPFELSHVPVQLVSEGVEAR
jgi:hypothetical protein